MNYQNSIQYPAQPVSGVKFKARARREKNGAGLPGGTVLWMTASKIALAIVFVAFCINLWLNFSITRGEQNIQAFEAARHQLKEEQIVLLAKRANLMSKRQVLQRAGDELALFVPGEKQVFRLR